MEKILRIENIEKYYGNKTNKVLCLIVFLRLIELLVDIFI